MFADCLVKRSYAIFLERYNNKDVVLTLEATQKLIVFYHNKGIDMFFLDAHYQFWPIFPYMNKQMQKLIHSPKRMRICSKKHKKISLLDRP